MSDLSPKQQAFIREYILCRNASEAMRRAGYKSKNPNVDSSKLLANPSISAAIKKIEAETIKKFEITHEDVLRGIHKIATFSPAEVLEWDGNALIFKKGVDLNKLVGSNFSIYPEYQSQKDKDKGIMRARLSVQPGDAKGAWELLGKYLGMWSKDEKDPGSGADKDPATNAIGRAVEIINGRIRRRSQKTNSDSQDGNGQ